MVEEWWSDGSWVLLQEIFSPLSANISKLSEKQNTEYNYDFKIIRVCIASKVVGWV